MLELGLLVISVIALIRAPRWAALGLVFMVVAFDGVTLDFTAPIGRALYQMSPEMTRIFPATMAPVGVYAIALCGRLALERAPDSLARAQALPRLAWLVPAIIAFGFAWGILSGGMANFAYHESRGLLVAIAVFVGVRAMRPFGVIALQRLVIVSTAVLAVVIILRYFVVTRGLPIGETAYAHESVLFLGIGVIVGILGIAQSHNMAGRGLFAAFTLLLLVATICTGRRSGTLVILVALIILAILLLFRRPIWVLALATLFSLAFGLYLTAYWHSEYGAISQPARAIRSQFAPSDRDYNSDFYRLIETYNVTQTIRTSPVLGLGLGRPFIRFASLWEISGWPLQFFVPHDNLLWLWLKFGLPGLGVFGGLWAIAMGNAIRLARSSGSPGIPAYPLALAASLVIYLQFMQVDIVLGERAMIPFAIVMALTLSLPEPTRQTALAPVRIPKGRQAPSARYFGGAV